MDRHLERLKKLNTSECLWVYVLKMLSREPSHGYVLRKQISDEFGFIPGNVTAYKVLYDLQLMGLVIKKKDGMKRIYEITEKGRKDLKEAIDYYKNLAAKLEA